MSEQKLNKKLAEWAGLHPRKTRSGYTIQRVNSPDFTHSLDACFKWLVPKTKIAGFTVRTDDKNPALTLCLAIEKLIDEGGR